MKCRIISSKSDTKTIIILHKIKFGKLGFSIFLFLGKNLIYSRKIFKSLNLEYPPTSECYSEIGRFFPCRRKSKKSHMTKFLNCSMKITFFNVLCYLKHALKMFFKILWDRKHKFQQNKKHIYQHY